MHRSRWGEHHDAPEHRGWSQSSNPPDQQRSNQGIRLPGPESLISGAPGDIQYSGRPHGDQYDARPRNASHDLAPFLNHDQSRPDSPHIAHRYEQDPETHTRQRKCCAIISALDSYIRSTLSSRRHRLRRRTTDSHDFIVSIAISTDLLRG